MKLEQIKFIPMTESSTFKDLKKNEVPLSDAELAQVRIGHAVWGETPAIFKSEDSDGKVVYVAHSQGAMNASITLEAAIERFHRFIKGTARLTKP